MRYIILLALLTGCSGLHEGEHVGPFEGMLWAVNCATDTPESLYDRWIEESPNYCDAELNEEGISAYEMCQSQYRVRYRWEWAKDEYRRRCERST